MKRGTIEHPKTMRLAACLRVRLLEAVGVLESLWHWAGKYARRGDLGQYPDELIATGVHWHGTPARLIQGLMESGWVDKHPQFRLVIHDWHEHADEGVRKWLASHSETFWNGAEPFCSRSRASREEVESNSRGSREPLQPRAREPVPVPVPVPNTPIAPAGAVGSGGGVDSMPVTTAFLLALGQTTKRTFPETEYPQWAKQIVRLAQEHQLGYARVREVLTWYARHATEDMMPVIGQPIDVVTKWPSMERAYRKSGAWRKPAPPPPGPPPVAPRNEEIPRLIAELAPKLKGRESVFREWMVQQGLELEVDLWDGNAGRLSAPTVSAALRFVQEKPHA